MTSENPLERRLTPWLTLAVGLLAAAALVVSVLRVTRAWANETYLGYAEGIWTAIAIDVSHGVFYRPLTGPLGYGGTRYFPLFFSLHGGLIRAGLAPLAAGHLVATLSVLLLLAAVAAFVRSAGGGWLAAGAAAAAALVCQPVQMALLTIRGDALPAALAVAGLAAVARRRGTLAAIAFTLAFAAKPTSLYAPAAAVAWLALDRQPREAARLALRAAAGGALVLVLMTLVSHGRALGVIAASAAGGGTLQSLLGAPVSLARILNRVPVSLFFMEIAAAVIVTRGRLTLERAAALVCAAATVAIFASPATVENHLIDLTVLAIVTVAVWSRREPPLQALALVLLLIGAAAALSTAVWRYQSDDRQDLHAARASLVASAGATAPTWLVEQPMLAAEAREQTYLLDPYLFSQRLIRDPSALDPLLADLRAHRFGAVVLEHAALDLAVHDTFPGPAGARFLSVLQDTYRLDRTVDGRPVFLPR